MLFWRAAIMLFLPRTPAFPLIIHDENGSPTKCSTLLASCTGEVKICKGNVLPCEMIPDTLRHWVMSLPSDWCVSVCISKVMSMTKQIVKEYARGSLPFCRCYFDWIKRRHAWQGRLMLLLYCWWSCLNGSMRNTRRLLTASRQRAWSS